MAKNRQFKKSPFVIRPGKGGMSWFVYLRGRSKGISEFASEKAAQNWIDYKSKSWLRKREAARNA
jgi:hypothetical protein